MLTHDQIYETVNRTVLSLDQFVTFSLSNDGSRIFSRHVEGEPGEDPVVDEEVSQIIDPELIVDAIREALQDGGVPDDKWEFEIKRDETKYEKRIRKERTARAKRWNDRLPNSHIGNQTYPRKIWSLTVRLVRKPVMCDEETMILIKWLATEGAWKRSENTATGKDYIGRGISLAKSKRFVAGQRVSYQRREYWFISSARSSGIGRFLLLNNKGKVCSVSSTGLVQPVYEKEPSNEEETQD